MSLLAALVALVIVGVILAGVGAVLICGALELRDWLRSQR